MQAVRMAVVHPCDALSLSSVIDARNAGIIVPVLVVPEAKLRTIARGDGFDLAGCEIIDVPHSHAAAAVAAEMAGRGEVETLMQGRSEEHTSEVQSLIRISYAVLSSKTHINTTKNPTTS